MAIRDNRLESNVPGKFYVDDQCIDCDLCRETCPQCFKRDDDTGTSIVYHQPDNDDDLSLCEDAMNSCPVGAIGDDGE